MHTSPIFFVEQETSERRQKSFNGSFTAKSFRVVFMKGISEYQRYEFVVAPPFEFGLGFSGFSSPTTFLNVDDLLVNRSVSLIC